MECKSRGDALKERCPKRCRRWVTLSHFWQRLARRSPTSCGKIRNALSLLGITTAAPGMGAPAGPAGTGRGLLIWVQVVREGVVFGCR
jgi:hypothetical protein